jgi:hypothetical protein
MTDRIALFAVSRVRGTVLELASESTLMFLGVADLPRCLYQIPLVDIVPVRVSTRDDEILRV